MVTFINLNNEKKETYSFEKPGKYVAFFHNLSGKFTFELRTEGIDLDIYGLFTGEEKNEYKIETIQHHIAPKSLSNLLIKGVFYDESKLIYQGLIRIEKSGQQSHAYQKNQNLILSPNVFVDSRPFLEILANDVFCTHGSTTGKLNKEQILYVQSRGLDKKNAEKLLVQGFIDEIYDKVRERVPEFKGHTNLEL